MKYQTTNLQPTKRYPTYQFHARTAQKKLPAEQVFCICVLETLHWLRSRLKKFSSLPEDSAHRSRHNMKPFPCSSCTRFTPRWGRLSM